MSDREKSIRFTKDGIAGILIEKKVFADSPRQLERIWQLPFSEIQRADALILPGELHTFTGKAFQLSTQDGKERAATVGWDGRGITISNEQVGKPSLYDLIGRGPTGKFELSIDSLFSFALKRLIARPQPIHFHTHPDYSEEALSQVNEISLVTPTGKRIQIPEESYIKYHRYVSSIFSAPDLMVTIESGRYVNSELLLAPERYLYIVPNEFKLKYGIQGSKEYREFDKASDIAGATALMYYCGLDSSDFLTGLTPNSRKKRHLFEVYKMADRNLGNIQSEDELFLLRDMALLDFCRKTGQSAFASNSRDDFMLKRLT